MSRFPIHSVMEQKSVFKHAEFQVSSGLTTMISKNTNLMVKNTQVKTKFSISIE